ncbi:DUF2589 domain-containing protein [Alistipes sp. ZOR0009]|uniref:DUF2589 domain-containing protein n=1 Tax=Alistipes sp. ZOR0009 TaxID=1339253 RepID=UPI000649073E|nr:DUF2589 domain-containing protein [Alistipes sp. ZOR0009]
MSQELVSMAQAFSGLPMDSLIGGPLNAAAKANAAMALTQTSFLLDTCFSKKDEKNYEPILISMTLTRGVIQPAEAGKDPIIKQVQTKFELPILTIIPLNSLAVDNVDISFEMEVKSSFGEDTHEEKSKALKAESSFEAKFGYGPFSATIKGSVSYDQKESSSRDTHYQKSNSAKYTVNVHAGQLPLPQGVTTIIDAFTKSIEPIELPVSK